MESLLLSRVHLFRDFLCTLKPFLALVHRLERHLCLAHLHMSESDFCPSLAYRCKFDLGPLSPLHRSTCYLSPLCFFRVCINILFKGLDHVNHATQCFLMQGTLQIYRTCLKPSVLASNVLMVKRASEYVECALDNV
jgi:hypothetical protein